MQIGWIGLGNMGNRMARNLMTAGHQVLVYNRTRSRAADLEAAGAKLADSPSHAAAASVVVTMLADDTAVEEIAFGAGKVLEAMARGSIHVSMSTISVELSTRLAEAHEKRGQVYVAAPVFGRPEAAAAAKLFIVAAGPRAAVERCQPLFDAMGQRTYFMGEDAPAAHLVKLTGNFMIAAVIETLGEAFALVRKYGVEPENFLEFLTTSLFAAPVYKTYGTLIAEDKYQPVGFRLALGLKDARLALAAAEAASVPLPVASLIRDHMLAAMARGMQDADWASFARLAAENAGLKPRA